MKLADAILCARKDRESSLHPPVKLMPACFRVGKARQRNFHNCGGPVKLVRSCLSASKDRESNFHSYGGPVMLVEVCLSAGKIQEGSSTHRGSFVKLFMCKERWRKQFSRLEVLWSSCRPF